MAVEAFFPIEALREHTSALEALWTVSSPDQSSKAVHRLRTETRRVEALLTMLNDLPGTPAHRDEAHALRRLLGRLRRTAGAVRDLDVQTKHLADFAGAQKQAPAEWNAASGSGAGLIDKTRKGSLQGGAEALRKHLESKREAAAARLQTFLKKHHAKVAKAAQRLLGQFRLAEELPVPAGKALELADALLLRGGLLAQSLTRALDEDDLHTVRKAAKAARYLAEMLPATPRARAAARRFEDLQEAGGRWHDALDLGRAAKRFLGKHHPLTAAVHAERDRHLRLYREALRTEARRAGGKKRADIPENVAMAMPVSVHSS